MLKRTCLVMSLAFMAGAFVVPTAARADPAPSRERVVSPREEILRRVKVLLEDEAVRDRMKTMGLDRQDIEDRLAQLDDAQLQQLAQQLDGAAIGRGAIGVVLVLLLVAALVLVIVYLAQRV